MKDRGPSSGDAMKRWSTIGDYVISALIVTPLVIVFWRSLWEYWYKYLHNYWLWLGAALFMNLVAFILPPPSRPHPIITYLHIYVTKIFGVMGWFNTWLLGNRYITFEDFPNIICAVLSLGLLIFLRGVRNLNSQPYTVSMDSKPSNVFIARTFFDTKSRGTSPMYLLDCLFSVCVIGTLVVFVWRGCWTLLDNHLFPDNPPYSAFASTVIGYVVVLISFSAQELVKGMVRKLSGLPRLILVDVYLLFSFCGTINVWRGIWSSLNIYLLPNDLVMSCLICHVVSFLMLVLLNSSNSVLVRGVYIDAEEEGDTCVDFPCYYLRLILQDKIKKKLTEKKASLVEEGLKEGLMEVNKKIQIVSSNGSTTINDQTKQNSPESNTLLSASE